MRLEEEPSERGEQKKLSFYRGLKDSFCTVPLTFSGMTSPVLESRPSFLVKLLDEFAKNIVNAILYAILKALGISRL